MLGSDKISKVSRAAVGCRVPGDLLEETEVASGIYDVDGTRHLSEF